MPAVKNLDDVDELPSYEKKKPVIRREGGMPYYLIGKKEKSSSLTRHAFERNNKNSFQR